jgi:hypothetical protein
MRSLRFFPVALLAGQHGFVLLMPYLALCLAVARLMTLRREARRARLSRQPAF